MTLVRTARKRYLTVISILITGLTAVTLLLMPQFTISAQEPTPTRTIEPGAVPDGPHDPAAEATWQAMEATRQAEINSRSIFDFQVAYLIAPNAVAANSIVSEQGFEETFGAQIIHTWDEFLEQEALHPFQILLIHDSFYDQIDFAWTQAAYRSKIIIVGIGMPFDHLVEVTGDHCVKEPNPNLRKYVDRMWLEFTYILALEDENYRAYIDNSIFGSCKFRIPSGTTRGGIQHGTTNALVSDTGFTLEFFVSSLISETMAYEIDPSNFGPIVTPLASPESTLEVLPSLILEASETPVK